MAKIVLIETKLGDIKIQLYDETPLHRDNFIKNIEEGVYNKMPFHRVIQGFMIQGGDLSANKGAGLDLKKYDYELEPEFRFKELFHRRGVIAAARLDDNLNPEKKSSSTQFYITTGRAYKEEELKQLEKTRFENFKIEIQKRLQVENTDKVKELYRSGDRQALAEFRESLIAEAVEEAKARKHEIVYTEVQLDAYIVIGGTPHLDGQYTVFGYILEGLGVVDKIEKMEVNEQDRPYEDVLFSIKVIEE